MTRSWIHTRRTFYQLCNQMRYILWLLERVVQDMYGTCSCLNLGFNRIVPNKGSGFVINVWTWLMQSISHQNILERTVNQRCGLLAMASNSTKRITYGCILWVNVTIIPHILFHYWSGSTKTSSSLALAIWSNVISVYPALGWAVPFHSSDIRVVFAFF